MEEKPLKSGTVRLRVWGENACFTRPEMKVERVSYDVMTPSAARGILEAIHWKPAIRWRVEQIDVLKPIRWESVRRNEVGRAMSPGADGLYIDDPNVRQQRAGLLLRDVDYVIHACFEITERAGPEDTVAKHREMFLRRAEKGQCFYQPFLGCREFAARFALVKQDEAIPEATGRPSELGFGRPRELGFMLYDVFHDNSADRGTAHFCGDKCYSFFFKATLENGRLKVPPLDSGEVRS